MSCAPSTCATCWRAAPPTTGPIRSLVESSAHASNFGDPSKPWYYPMDMEMALRVDSYPFAIRVDRKGGLLVARAFEA